MKKIREILLTILGVLITSVAISLFLTPNKVVCGGVSGISTILYHAFSLPPGLTFAMLNVILLIAGLKVLGWAFTVKTLLGSGLLSVCVQMFSYLPPFTENVVLAAIFGGVLYGIGIGISFVAGASTGGTDIMGRLLQSKFPSLPIGKLLLVVDGIIIFASLIVFRNIDLTLFGIVALFLYTCSVDWLMAILNVSTISFVITEKGDEIAELLVNSSPRGVTVIDVVGAYTSVNKKMLFCALKEKEMVEFKKRVLEIDPQAFIVFSKSQKIVGNGFYVYI